jgi:predicted AAA+ superfamily ATPase
MFRRNLVKELENWVKKPDRKPLILRGARQTGKTVAVDLFAEQFTHFISLNLERAADCAVFEKSESIAQVIQAIELAKGKSPLADDTLLFIDEIQNSAKAISFLRYFYEDYPKIHVIAAGSLLEAVMLKEGFSFPVGRVEFLYLYPVTFDEYLLACGKEKLHQEICHVTLREKPTPILHKLALESFNQYALVGGMPAVVANFIENNSFESIADLKEDLLTAIKDDVSKYSRVSEGKYLRHVIEYAPYYVGERITYNKFGNSEYRSREIKQAFELLEYAMVTQRVFGSFDLSLPIRPNFKVSPRLLYLDSGLVVHKLGLTQEAIFATDLNALFKGKLAEQVVGQALLAHNLHRKVTPCFWYRNAQGSVAEIDYSYALGDQVLPIEVKSGKTGTLKSLIQFMSASPATRAVRIYSGELSIDRISVGQKSFELISLPFYLQWRMDDLLAL